MNLYIDLDLKKAGEPPKPPAPPKEAKTPAVQAPGAEGSAGRPAEGGPDTSGARWVKKEDIPEGAKVVKETDSGAYIEGGSGGGKGEDEGKDSEKELEGDSISKEDLEARESQDPADVSDPLKEGSGKELGVEDVSAEPPAEEGDQEGAPEEDLDSVFDAAQEEKDEALFQEQYNKLRELNEGDLDTQNTDFASPWGEGEEASGSEEPPEVVEPSPSETEPKPKEEQAEDELNQLMEEIADPAKFEQHVADIEAAQSRAEKYQAIVEARQALIADRKASGAPPTASENRVANEVTAGILSDLVGEQIDPKDLGGEEVGDSDPPAGPEDMFAVDESEISPGFEQQAPDLAQEAMNRDTSPDQASAKPTTNYHRKSDKALANELTKHEILIRNKQRDHRAETEEHNSQQAKMQQQIDDIDAHIDNIKGEMDHPSTVRSNRTNLERKKKEIESLAEKLGQSNPKISSKVREIGNIESQRTSLENAASKQREILESKNNKLLEKQEGLQKEVDELKSKLSDDPNKEASNKDIEKQVASKERELKSIESKLDSSTDALSKHDIAHTKKMDELNLKAKKIKDEVGDLSGGVEEQDQAIIQKIKKNWDDIGNLQSAVDSHEQKEKKIKDLKKKQGEVKRDKKAKDTAHKTRQKQEMADLKQEQASIKSAISAKKQGRAGILQARNRRTKQFRAGSGVGARAAQMSSTGQSSGVGAVSDAAQAVAGKVASGARAVGSKAADAAGSGVDYIKDKLGKDGEAGKVGSDKPDKKAAARAAKHEKAQAKKIPKAPKKVKDAKPKKYKKILGYNPKSGKMETVKRSMGLYIDLEKAVGSKPNMAVNSDKDPDQVEEDYDTSFDQRTAGVNADASPDDPDVGKDWRGPVEKAVEELDSLTKSLQGFGRPDSKLSSQELNVLKSLGYEEEYIHTNYSRLKSRHYNEIHGILNVQVKKALTDLERMFDD